MITRLRFRLFLLWTAVALPPVLALAHMVDSWPMFWDDLKYGAANLWHAFKKGEPLD